VLAISVIGVTFLPVVRFLPRWSLSNRYIRSFLKTARPERSPNKFLVSPGYRNHPKFSSFLSLSLPTVGAITPAVAGTPTYPTLYSVHDLFFHLGGGLPLHKVHLFIFRNPLEAPTTCFAIFPLKISSDFSRSSDAVAVLCLGPLFWFCLETALWGLGTLRHICVADLSTVFLRLFVLSEFSV
jgi:hypothetical protein